MKHLLIYLKDYKKGEVLKNDITKSRWAQIVEEVQEGDFFIFFTGGINDHGQISYDTYRPNPYGDYILDDFMQFFENKDVYMYVGENFGTHSFYTIRSTVEEYSEILTDMINSLKQKGAIPILVRGTGKYYMRNNNNYDVFAASHRYMKTLPEVAENTGILYLTVGEIFEEGFQKIGYQEMLANYFLTIEAVNKLNIKYNRQNKTNYNDVCHHNIDGAKYICDIFIDEIKKTDSSFKEYLK